MLLVLNLDVEILENDLCDGIEVMNNVIEKCFENELDRMIVILRLKKRIEFVVVLVMSGSLVFVYEELEEVIL